MRRLILSTILLIGCVDYRGQYIDSSCTENEIIAINESVATLNTAVGYPRVDISGIIDHGESGVYGDPEYDIIICVDRGSSLLSEGLDGAHWRGDIVLRHTADEKLFQNVTMHELGHYIGAEHVDDREAIMHYQSSRLTEYTPADLAEFEDL